MAHQALLEVNYERLANWFPEAERPPVAPPQQPALALTNDIGCRPDLLTLGQYRSQMLVGDEHRKSSAGLLQVGGSGSGSRTSGMDRLATGAGALLPVRRATPDHLFLG